MKKIICLFLMLIMILIVSTKGETVKAIEILDSGICGEKVEWTLLADGTFIISGQGDMENFKFEQQPWKEYIDKISKIVIGEDISRIGKYAFQGCKTLKEVTIPGNVKVIESRAFDGTGLEKITLLEGIEEIGYYALGYNNLQKVILPESVRILGGSVFAYCEKLEYVRIGKNLKTMYTSYYGYGDNFRNCPLLKTAGPNENYNIHYTWEKDIPEEAFFKTTSLEKVEIADSIENIGNKAFASCNVLSNLKLGKETINIGDYAFRECSLSYIDFGLNLKTIGEGAFIGTNIRNISIPKNVETIGKAALGYNVSIVGKDSRLVPVKVEGCKIKGYKDSEAERYARENGIVFEEVEKNSVSNSANNKKQIIIVENSMVVKGITSLDLNAKANGDGKLTYISSNSKVAKISSKGKIQAKGYGVATITIKASKTKNYNEAVKKVTIRVVPKKIRLKTVKSPGRKRLSATWGKDKTVTGYRVQFCIRKDFKQGTFQRTYSKSKGGMKIYGLRSNKTFYFRVCAYKKVGKKKYYGAWSKVKKVKIK